MFDTRYRDELVEMLDRLEPGSPDYEFYLRLYEEESMNLARLHEEVKEL